MTDDDLDDWLRRTDEDIIETLGRVYDDEADLARLKANVDPFEGREDPMTELRSHCDCGRRVRVLWSGPLGPDSRPILLVCGYHPERRCRFRQVIPEDKVTR